MTDPAAILPEAPAFPLFICGLPRSGTSFLFAVLSTHPAFANENYKDKELRYYEKLIGNRPWGQIDGVSQKKFAAIDRQILPELVRTLDARLRALRGGPRGHYLNANPRDIFCSEFILEAVPEARFVVCLRDPLTNVWSALNYPSHTWGEPLDDGLFCEEDVRRTAEHWNKVTAHILRHGLAGRPQTCFLLEQERLAAGDPALHAGLERFLGLPGVAALLDSQADLVIHSSFLENTDNKGRDRRFSAREQKIGHFRDVERAAQSDPRYVAVVLDTCGANIRKLAGLGLMARGPSLPLLGEERQA